MWALGVIATVAAIGAVARYFVGRDHVPPMERHVRALDALRNLAEQQRPAASETTPTSETPTDHVRILAEGPDDIRRTRRAPARRSTTKPAWGTDRPTIAIRPTGERGSARPVGASASASAAPSSLRASDADDEGRHGFARAPSRVYAGAAAAAAVVLVAIVAIVVAVGTIGRGSNGAPGSKAPKGAAAPVPTVASTTSTSNSSTTIPAKVVPVITRTTDGATVSVRSPFLLILQTTAPCWVQLTDASGHTLFAATLQSGGQQQIPGSGPFIMKLGNMSAVTMSVDGVNLDLGGLPQTANITFQTA